MKTNYLIQLPKITLKALLPALFIALAVALYVPEKIYAATLNAVDSGRVVQVVLGEHNKISQYDDIDSSDTGLGNNACGFVAAAAAVGGENWAAYIPLLAYAAGMDYGHDTGIQPTPLTATLQKVYGATRVTAYDNSTLQSIYNELQQGNIVIVDVKVNSIEGVPSAESPNYAHFARVLGIDITNEEIYIENTLRGAAYWTVSFQDFTDAWDHPETSVSVIPDNVTPEDVTNWFVALDSSLITTNDF